MSHSCSWKTNEKDPKASSNITLNTNTDDPKGQRVSGQTSNSYKTDFIDNAMRQLYKDRQISLNNLSSYKFEVIIDILYLFLEPPLNAQ